MGIRLIKEKILGISIATSHNIDTNKLNNLISTLDSTDAYYKELFEKFNKIKKENYLTFLYVGYIKDGKFIYLVDADDNLETQVKIGSP